MVKLPATHCSCYELEISQEKIFVAMVRPAKSMKIFNLENFRLYGSSCRSKCCVDSLFLPLVGGFELCGVDICGETICEITNFAQLFEWEDYGLKLHISEGTLPEGLDKCTVSIKASVAGQYQFPEDIQLVSAIFLLRCEPICKFAKAITMEMEHCAKSVNASKLSFVRAFCSQETLPYIFKKIGGHFSEDNCSGTVKLNGFSILGVGQEGSCQREYGTTIFHLIHQRSISNCCLKIDIVMTWNTKTHLNVSMHTVCIACYINIIWSLGCEERVQKKRC